MTDLEYELACIKHSQEEFESILENSSDGEIVQCLKLLAMYVALYKKEHGDICITTLESGPEGSHLHEIIQEGILEAGAMLRLIQTERYNSLLQNGTGSHMIN